MCLCPLRTRGAQACPTPVFRSFPTLMIVTQPMQRLVDLTLLAFERLWQHRILAFWSLVGLAVAATLALSIPLYVDAVNAGLLRSHLDNPPYAFLFRYLGSWEGNVTRDKVETADAAVTGRFVTQIGLPVQNQARYVRVGTWPVRFGEVNLGALGIGTLSGVEDRITIVSGEWSSAASPDAADTPIPVLLPEDALYDMGVQVGDELTVQVPKSGPVTLRVAALWRPLNPDDPAWVLPPHYFQDVVLMRAEDMWRVAETLEKPVEESDWWLIFDGDAVRPQQVRELSTRIIDGQREVFRAMPGMRLDVSPKEHLDAFSKDVSRLTRQLVLAVLPVVGLVLYFVSMVAASLVGRQRQEDIILRSRGMSRWGILRIHLLVWLLLAGGAFVTGIVLAPITVHVVGQTSSFLHFNGVGNALTVRFSVRALLAGAATSLLAASSGLFNAWRATMQSIIHYERNKARARMAWWQRLYLDVVLLAVGLYVFYTLRRKGGIATSAEDPFADPLTFAGPTLFALGATLFFLRVWVLVLRLGSRVAVLGRSMAILMAARELTRAVGRYRGGLLMMTFTLSLAGFTASMASTMDRSLEDVIAYRVGAQAVIITPADAQTKREKNQQQGQMRQQLKVVGYNTPPVEDLYRIPGVAYVSPVGHYQVRLDLPGQQLEGTVLGMDRATMAAVSAFRRDYAPEPLADLLNRLAGHRDGVLLQRSVAEANHLVVGQEIDLAIFALGQWHTLTAPVVGLVDYFPTLDPREGVFLLMNLEPIFEAVGSPLPHNVWLRLAPDADPAQVEQAVRESGFPVLEWRQTHDALQAARAEPSRRGVLGFLSIGFIATIALTLVSTIIQSTASFRAQAIQLGALRAMGLGNVAVGGYLTLVQGIAAMSGILGGTAIGLLATRLFLPYLDFSGGVPPYLVRVSWNEIALVYGLFACVLLVVTLFTTLVVGRQSVSALVKLGDA